MSTTNRVSKELREVEKEIDNYYRSNPIIKHPFATAAWYLMAYSENYLLEQMYRDLTSQEFEFMIDNLLNELKHPMFWIFNSCEQGGDPPSTFNENLFKTSSDLLELGSSYGWFDTAYRYASNGWVGLNLDGSNIQPTNELFSDQEYKAYNYFIKTYETDTAMSSIDLDNFHLIGEKIRHLVRVKGDRFSYKLNPKIVNETIEIIKPIYDSAFSLRSEWEFSRYTLGDFRKVFVSILAMATIHWRARMIAIAEKTCQNNALLDSIFLPTCNELLHRVVNYSGLPDEKVHYIFDDLTYGNRGIRFPDPALQPLIKLNSDYYAIMPQLWLSSHPERNLTVLLNKIPSEKKVYAKLKNEKEGLMRDHITAELTDKDFRFVSGNVADLPDVDLAIIDDSEKACLLLELKWFIDPAEIREIMDRSEDIKDGICQVLEFKQAFSNNYQPLFIKLKIDSSYRFKGIVVSKNWIGSAYIQSPEVPVIRANHLIEKLKATSSLQSTMGWLKNRKYLPKEGEHFNVRVKTSTIGNWKLKWPGAIKSLFEDKFLPL